MQTAKETWDVADPDAARDILKQAPKRIRIDDNRWEYADQSEFHRQEISLPVDDRLCITRILPDWMRVLVWLSVAFVPLAILSPSFVSAGWLAIIASVMWDSSMQPPDDIDVQRIETSIHPAFAILALGAAVTILRLVARPAQLHGIGIAFGVGLVGYTLTYLYSLDALPRINAPQLAQTLLFPLSIVRGGITLVSIFIAIVVINRIVVQTLTGWKTALDGVSSATDSFQIISVLTAGTTDTILGLLSLLEVFLPLAITSIALIWGLWMVTTFTTRVARVRERLLSLTTQPVRTTRLRWLVGLYTVWAVLGIAISALAIALVVYGIGETWVLPPWILEPVIQLTPGIENAPQLVEAGYRYITTLLSHLPVQLPGMTTTGIVILLTLPLLLLPCVLIGRLVSSVTKNLWSLFTAEPISTEKTEGQSQVTFKRGTPTQRPKIRYVSFPGLKPTVIIASSVLSKSSPVDTEDLYQHALSFDDQQNELLLVLLTILPGGGYARAILYEVMHHEAATSIADTPAETTDLFQENVDLSSGTGSTDGASASISEDSSSKVSPVFWARRLVGERLVLIFFGPEVNRFTFFL